LLDQVASEELERDLMPAPEVQAQVEEQGQPDPDAAPDRRLTEADLVRATAEDAEIEREHRHNERREAQPEQERGLAHVMRSLANADANADRNPARRVLWGTTIRQPQRLAPGFRLFSGQRNNLIDRARAHHD